MGNIKASTLICGTILVSLMFIGGFYLVGTGQDISRVVTLVTTLGGAATGIITLLVRLDHQDKRLGQIEQNTNGLLTGTVKEAVKIAVEESVVPAVVSAVERNDP